jgi:hypothetical protein
VWTISLIVGMMLDMCAEPSAERSDPVESPQIPAVVPPAQQSDHRSSVIWPALLLLAFSLLICLCLLVGHPITPTYMTDTIQQRLASGTIQVLLFDLIH